MDSNSSLFWAAVRVSRVGRFGNLGVSRWVREFEVQEWAWTDWRRDSRAKTAFLFQCM